MTITVKVRQNILNTIYYWKPKKKKSLHNTVTRKEISGIVIIRTTKIF